MNYVSVTGLARGGTNLVLSLFHYLPECYALSERTTAMFHQDNKNIKELNDKELFKSSMFGTPRILKEKSIRNIVFKTNASHNFEYDKNIFLLRNPFRVYISTKKYYKTKW